MLKRVSVTTCGLSLTVMPALLLTSGNASVPLAGKIAISGVVALAGVGSTGDDAAYLERAASCKSLFCFTAMLHFFMRSYIHKLYQNGEDNFTAHGLSFFGFHKENSFDLKDVEPLPESFNPFVTFEANGTAYFIQAGFFEDKKLLRTFIGRPLTEDEREYEELAADE